MNTDNILNKMLGKAKKNNNNFNTNINFQKPKPIKTTTIADKPVHIFNNHPIPSKQQINKVYKKIPDDTSIPLQFMTRQQYIKKYVANQEIKNGSPFNEEQKQEFLNYKKDKYSNIIGRYTTKNNPYYKPAVVVFNDPENQKNIKGKKFEELAWHEYGHELAEKKKLKLTPIKEEMFADGIADYGMKVKIYSDKRAKNKVLREIQKDNISMDGYSKNELVEFKNLKIPVYKNPTRAESKDIYERAISEGIHGDTPKSRKTFDTEGNRYEWMSNDAIHQTVESQLLHEKGTLTNQNQHFDIAYDRLTEDEESKDKKFSVQIKKRYPDTEIQWMNTDKILKQHQETDGPEYDITQPKNQIGHRLQNAQEYIQKEEYKTTGFEAPLLNAKGSVTDGRHRILALKNLGYTEIPIEIEKDEYSENKFTPNIDKTKASELTAAQKFGALNLQGLKKIGAGRDRDVYALDDDKVIKIAKNPGGLTQNQGERDLEYLEMGKQYEQGKDYVVMKKQKPLSKEGKKKLGQIRKQVDEHTNTMSPSYRTDVAVELSKENNILDQTGIGTEILDFQPNPQEVFANRQWGEDEEGNLVLLDGGALQDNQSLSRFRVKDYKPTDWQTKEWQETQQERKQYKDKGTYDKERKFNKGYMEYETEIPDEPLNDEYSKDSRQSLWHAGDKPPSETLKEQGRVYGFSSKEYADGWREKEGKQNIYQFTADEYDLDNKTYIRDTPQGKKYSDNEYIVKNVLGERIHED